MIRLHPAGLALIVALLALCPPLAVGFQSRESALHKALNLAEVETFEGEVTSVEAQGANTDNSVVLNTVVAGADGKAVAQNNVQLTQTLVGKDGAAVAANNIALNEVAVGQNGAAVAVNNIKVEPVAVSSNGNAVAVNNIQNNQVIVGNNGRAVVARNVVMQRT